MATITLYKWENYQAVDGWDVKKGFSMTGTMSSNFVGEVSEPVEYTLPQGYELAESNMETLEVYDSSGSHCEIGILADQPTLISASGKVVLQQAGK